MKKFLFLTLIFGAIISMSAYAQPAGDPPTVLQQMKESQRPGLVEKAGLTATQADKLIEINYEIRMALGTALKGLNETERAAKIAEYKTIKEKKYSEIPLTPEQIKAVYTYYEDMGKNMEQRKKN